jgi:hypothetical protein
MKSGRSKGKCKRKVRKGKERGGGKEMVKGEKGSRWEMGRG